MTELKQDVKLAVTKFTAEEKAAMQAEAAKAKSWWSAHKVWACISLACGVVGFILAKIG